MGGRLSLQKEMYDSQWQTFRLKQQEKIYPKCSVNTRAHYLRGKNLYSRILWESHNFYFYLKQRDEFSIYVQPSCHLVTSPAAGQVLTPSTVCRPLPDDTVLSTHTADDRPPAIPPITIILGEPVTKQVRRYYKLVSHGNEMWGHRGQAPQT